MLKEISKFGFHYITKNFAKSLFSIFIPVFLLANGFSLFQVGIFYIVQEVVNLICTFILFKQIHKIKIKKLLVIATLAQIISVFGIYQLISVEYFFLLTFALIRGFHDSLYWGSYGITILNLSKKDQEGGFLGTWELILQIVSFVVAPISGYLLDNISPFWLVSLSILLLIISIVPLITFNLPILRNNEPINFQAILKKKESPYILMSSNLSEFLTKVLDTLIPVYLFIVFHNFFYAGLAIGIMAIGRGAYAYILGKRSDNLRNRKIQFFTNLFGFLIILLLIPFFDNVVLIFLLIAVLEFFRIGFYITTESSINKISRENNGYSNKIFSRMAENAAGILIGGIIAIANFSFAALFFVSTTYVSIITLLVYKYRKII